MSAAARLFEGEHDFTTFAASSGSDDVDGEREMLRVIYSSQIIRPSDVDEIQYVVHGRSFLRYMVRKIVGTLLEVGRGRLTPGDIPQIFELRDRSRSGPTVPPEGLYLVALDYPTRRLSGVFSRCSPPRFANLAGFPRKRMASSRRQIRYNREKMAVTPQSLPTTSLPPRFRRFDRSGHESSNCALPGCPLDDVPQAIELARRVKENGLHAR